MHRSLHKETCKLFADLALVRKEMEMREMNETQNDRDRLKSKQEEKSQAAKGME